MNLCFSFKLYTTIHEFEHASLFYFLETKHGCRNVAGTMTLNTWFMQPSFWARPNTHEAHMHRICMCHKL